MRHDAEGYWLREAGEREGLAAASGELDCDVLIVGGGFTGLWAAWELAELAPQASVIVLEAGRCGHGPSGRNGGFANEMWFSLPSLHDRYGPVESLAIARAAREAVNAIERFCDEQEVDAWFRRAGYLQLSAAPAQDGTWSQAVALCRQLGEGEAVRELDTAEVAERCRSPRFRGGALYPGAATVQPARLALGLRDRVAARSSVRVFEGSRVRRLRAGPGGCVAETGSARVRAGACVLASGPALAGVRSPLRGRLTVASSHQVITEPVPDLLEEVGWTGGECITDGRAIVHYMRTTPDGRIAFGWGGGRIAAGGRVGGRAELDPEVAAETIAHLRSFFPQLEGREIAHAWGGPIDVSPTHLPFVRRIGSDRAWAAAGYTGNGVGPSRMIGRVLASLALERRDAHSRLALVDPDTTRIPGGLAGWAGGSAIRAALLAKESAEEEDRRPPAIARGLAAIPELIGFHLGR